MNSRRIGLTTHDTEHLGKLPPQAVEMEEAVLGAILLERHTVDLVAEIIDAESFYKDAHQEIYQAVIELKADFQPIDIKTVTHQLRKNGKLETVGGAHYVAELTTKVNSAANVEYHARIISEQALKRELIRISSDIQREAYEDTSDIFQLLDKASIDLVNATGSHTSHHVNLRDIMPELIEEIQENKRARNENRFVGVPTGLVALDRKTAGWQNGDLVVIAARPGMGKTALINTMLKNQGIDQKIPVGFLSMEMTNRQTGMRELAILSGVGIDRMINGKVTDEEMERIMAAAAIIAEGKIYIDDSPALTPYEIRSKATMMVVKYGIKVLYFDYIQIGSDEDSRTKEQAVSKISSTLKSVAKDLNIPVVALSQLSRAVESRPDKRPMLSDLRDSGSIEQDADMVLFLYRPEYYGLTTNSSGQSTIGLGEIIIAKYRNGNPTNGWFRFKGSKMLWEDYQQDAELPFNERAEKDDEEKPF